MNPPTSPTFSVIIPTYNRRSFLLECLASVNGQRYLPHEVIVVDDGSTDGTSEALAGMEGITLIRQDNAGPGAARNRGAAAATGEYLAFLDSDDLWFPWTLETLALAVDAANKPAFIVGPNVQVNDLNESDNFRQEVMEIKSFENLFCAFNKYDIPVPTPSTAIRAETFDAVGGFAGLFVGEDVDLWLRLGTQQNFLWLLAPPLSAQRRHDASITGDYKKSSDGVAFLLNAERTGNYPGGSDWRDVRERRLSAAARATSLDAARFDLQRAFGLYWKSVPFNFRQRRLRYLLGFPAEAVRRRLAGWSNAKRAAP